MATSSPAPGARRADPLDRRHLERRELIARRLLPAVERLLEHETYPELTVDQMATEADISRSTFYNYFEDKGDLLRVLAADVMGAIVDASRVWWMLSPAASKRDLRTAMRHLFEVYNPHAALMLAVADSISHDSRVRDEFLAYMERGRDEIANYIRVGQAAGGLRSDLNAAATASWLTWMLERGLSQLSRTPKEHEPDRVVDAVVDIIWKALR
jgi:TetR/AcrR family transcriptional regulator, ethionamide resistance regulator